MDRGPLLFGIFLGLTGCNKEQPKEKPASERPAASASANAQAATPDVAQATSEGVTKLAADVEAGEELGYAAGAAGDSVAVSAFKRGKSGSDQNPGSVFVYKLSGGKATLETELVADSSHQIGNALGFDGTTLVAGALFDSGLGKDTGAAYAFSRADSGWSKAQKLATAKSKADDSFGIGVALAGKSIVVSDTREKGGSLFVFELGKKGFELRQTLPFIEDNGPAETIAAFDDVIAVGSVNAGKMNEQGVVHVYTRGAKGFAPSQVLTETTPAEEGHFGEAVAVGPSSLAVTSKSGITMLSRKDSKFEESARISTSPDALERRSGPVLAGPWKRHPGRRIAPRTRGACARLPAKSGRLEAHTYAQSPGRKEGRLVRPLGRARRQVGRGGRTAEKGPRRRRIFRRASVIT